MVLHSAPAAGSPTVSNSEIPPVAKPVASDMVTMNWAPLRNGMGDI